MFLPQRKSARIPKYNYASHNYYFITICTHEKKCLFYDPKYKSIAETCLTEIPKFYPQVMVDKWVVMPNHIHAILIFGNGTAEEILPNLTTVVGQYKMAVTKKIHKISPKINVWQRSFHDHIIRNEYGYQTIWGYIDNNPLKWEEDCFYCEIKEER